MTRDSSICSTRIIHAYLSLSFYNTQKIQMLLFKSINQINPTHFNNVNMYQQISGQLESDFTDMRYQILININVRPKVVN